MKHRNVRRIAPFGAALGGILAGPAVGAQVAPTAEAPVVWQGFAQPGTSVTAMIRPTWKLTKPGQTVDNLQVARGVADASGRVELRADAASIAGLTANRSYTLMVFGVGADNSSFGMEETVVSWQPATSGVAAKGGSSGAWVVDGGEAATAAGSASRTAFSSGPGGGTLELLPWTGLSAAAGAGTAARVPPGYACSTTTYVAAASQDHVIGQTWIEKAGSFGAGIAKETVTVKASNSTSADWGFKAGIGAGPVSIAGRVSFATGNTTSYGAGSTAVPIASDAGYVIASRYEYRRYRLNCTSFANPYVPATLTTVEPYKYAGTTVHWGGAAGLPAPTAHKVTMSRWSFKEKSSGVTSSRTTGVEASLSGDAGPVTLSGGVSYTAVTSGGFETSRRWINDSNTYDKYVYGLSGNPQTSSDTQIMIRAV